MNRERFRRDAVTPANLTDLVGKAMICALPDGCHRKTPRPNPTRKWGDGSMPLIKVREEESLENALKRFKRKCEKSGILTEIKKRQHYEKPSVRKKRKALAARKKLLKRLAQERKMNG